MNELEQKLSKFKEIKADAAWKSSNRSLLLGQISMADEPRYSWLKALALELPFQFAKAVPHSATVVVAVLLVLLGGGFAGLQASENSKPGDTLYVAKIAGEKTQLALTFDDKKKAQLSLEFAGNRAKELSQVLNEEQGGQEERVEKLVSKFRQEISTLRSQVEKISQAEPKADPKLASKPEEKALESTPETALEGDLEAETEYFSAGSVKDDNGISTSEQSAETAAPVQTEPTEVFASGSEIEIAASASPTAEILVAESKAGDSERIFKEAEALLESEDYSTLLNKISEAEEAVGRMDTGLVKGESEEASTTAVYIVGTSTGESLDPGDPATTTSDK